MQKASVGCAEHKPIGLCLGTARWILGRTGRQYLGRILGLVLLARGHRHPAAAAAAGHDAVGAGRLRDAVAAGAEFAQVRL